MRRQHEPAMKDEGDIEMGKLRIIRTALCLAFASILISGCTPVIAPGADPTPTQTTDGSTDLPDHLKTISELSYRTNGSMQFGYGFDSITGMPKNSAESAINYASAEQVAGLTQGSATAYFVESKTDIYKAMDISASASYSGVIWGADAKADYASSLAIKSDCVNFIIRGRVFGHTYRISGEALKPEVVARNLSKEEFYTYYGDKYLYEMVTGAEYYAYVQVDCHSRDQKSKIEASVSANAFGGSVKSSMASELNSYVSSNQISVSVATFGGTPALATDLSAMISEINAFLKTSYSEPAAWQSGAITARYKSYWQLEDYPKIDVTAYKTAFAEALRKYNQDAFIYGTFLSDADLNGDSVADMSAENLDKRAKLAGDMATLGAALDAAASDGFDASSPSGLNYPDTPSGIDLNLGFVSLGMSNASFLIPDTLGIRIDAYNLYGLEGGFIPADIYEYFYLAEKYPFISKNPTPLDSSETIVNTGPIVKDYMTFNFYLTANGASAQAYLTQTDPDSLYTFPDPYDTEAETVKISAEGIAPTQFYPSLTNYDAD
jgi:hypothetical protein